MAFFHFDENIERGRRKREGRKERERNGDGEIKLNMICRCVTGFENECFYFIYPGASCSITNIYTHIFMVIFCCCNFDSSILVRLMMMFMLTMMMMMGV